MRTLLTVQNAAEHAQVSSKTIRRWIAIGVLSGYRVGPRAVRIDADELEALELRIPNAATSDRTRADDESGRHGAA